MYYIKCNILNVLKIFRGSDIHIVEVSIPLLLFLACSLAQLGALVFQPLCWFSLFQFYRFFAHDQVIAQFFIFSLNLCLGFLLMTFLLVLAQFV